MGSVFAELEPYQESLLLIMAIVAGAVVGLFTSFEVSLTDYFIIAMLFSLFYTISLEGLLHGVKDRKYLTIALLSNFIALPLIAFLLCKVFVDPTHAFFVGLIIYLVAPCTDWFLGFTKLAKGDVEVNSALLPLNLLLQILLLPAYLYVFTTNTIRIPFSAFFDVLIYWVLLPFIAAQLVRWAISKLRAHIFERSTQLAELLVFVTLVLLVFSIFNVNIGSLIANLGALPSVFAVILTFFITTFFLAKFVSSAFAFSKKQRVSLTMTTAARNAPLMLLISLLFFPGEPLIQLALVVGMMVEFPHLIAITHLLKRDQARHGAQKV